MPEIILTKPKIKDLIKALLEFGEDKDIRIDDADTGWNIYIIHIEEYQGTVRLYGRYDEMGDEKA